MSDLQPYESKIERIVDDLNNAKAPAALLIGAGCSVSAGIPSANGFARLIQRRFGSVNGSTYAECMGELRKQQQKDLLQEKIREAQINWTHIAIAQLIQVGLVDRVLTTNFDPLLLQACALINLFPAVYDFAAAPSTFRPTAVSDPSIFHLHGQGTGFVLMNAQEEMDDLATSLPGLLTDTLKDRTLIVVGYGGNDPVFRKLAAHGDFDHGVYWITYEQANPPPHVQTDLLEAWTNASFVRSPDSDRFFIDLAQRLECFPPAYIKTPFTYLKDQFDLITDFPTGPGDTKDESELGDEEIDVMAGPQEMVGDAIHHFEEGLGKLKNKAWSHIAEGRHGAVEAMWEKAEGEEKDALRGPYAASLVQLIREDHKELWGKGRPWDGQELKDLEEQYASVLEVKPDSARALFGIGLVLSQRSELASGDEAERLLDASMGKYEATVEVKPDTHEALHNWGVALSGKAKRTSGEDALALFDAAIEKYKAAVDVKPDTHKALYSWGHALSKKAQRTAGEDVLALFDAAIEKYEAAVDIKPDKHQALHQWGNVLAQKADRTSGDEALDLFDAAIQKWEATIAVKPDKHPALKNWGVALLRKADLASDEDEAAALREEGNRKIQKAEEMEEAQSSPGAATP